MDDRTARAETRRDRPLDDDPPSRASAAIVALFAGLIALPGVLALAGHAGADRDFILHTEARAPFVAPAPASGALATGGWQRDAERSIADGFPLRTPLIAAYHAIEFAGFRDVSSPHVIAGRDGWYFFADEERRYVEGDDDRSPAAIARTADAYAARAAWCRQHGIAYVFVLAPNKSTVYRNDLPADVRPVTPTLADLLVPAMRARGVRVVDVRAALGAAAAAASRGAGTDVYSKGDTHWNDAGAYIAYEATVAALRDAGVRDGVPRTAIRSRTVDGEGDLLRLAGIASLAPNQIVQYDVPQRAHAVAPPAIANDPDVASAFVLGATTTGDRALPNAVVFGDSFASALRRFLGEDFDTVLSATYVNAGATQFDRRIVETQKPRVVIQEIVERSLVFGPGADR